MDLSNLDTVSAANEGADLTILTPSGERTDIVLRLAGVDSDVYRKANRKAQDKRLAVLQKRGRQKMTSAEMEDEALSILAACTLDWSNVEEKGEGGKLQKLDCTTENVERIYREYPDIRRQADEFIGEAGNFTQN